LSTSTRLYLRPVAPVLETVPCSIGTATVLIAPRPTEEGATVINDDCAMVCELDGAGVVLAVADGAGGHRRGGEAAEVALKTLATELDEAAADESVLQAMVLAAFDRAAAAVRELGSEAVTTLSVAYVHATTVRTLHAGDSPIYVFGQRGKRKWQTMDHTPVGLGIAGGWIEVGEGQDHPERHLLTNFLGTEELRIEMGPSVSLARYDTLVLASDGLSDNATGKEIVGGLRSGRLDRRSRELFDVVAKRMAGQDDAVAGKTDDFTLVGFRRGKRK